MKKIYIECDTIQELVDIKSMLDTMAYDWEEYLILNANLKWRLKDTLSNATDYWYWDVVNYKTVLWIEVVADITKFFNS
jgi:hypothetical protein